jgi:ATP adenylyltransferase
MDHLWSPWRYQYVSSTGAVPSGKDFCLFCRVAGAHEDAANLVVFRGECCFVLLNRYPYSSGHLMIAPYAHVPTLEETETGTLEEMMRLAQRCEAALRQVYRPDGMNFGLNLGQAAGAGIAGHIHMHGLPRWLGDTSFMTTVGETRVLPEDLENTRQKLTAALGGESLGGTISSDR